MLARIKSDDKRCIIPVSS